MTFDELGLSPDLLKAIAEAGYTTPTPIQEQAIPHALQGRDILGVAQTGTGKTASFVLPMIERLASGRAKARMPRTLILEPTRELAAQVAENFEKYGKNHKLTMALLIGGVSFGDQDRLLTQGVDVLIATPGRLLDHFERGKLLLNGVQVMVVDEADRMLDMGFIPDIERIFKLTPFTRQTLFFSATMPPEIQRLTQQFLHNPQKIEVTRSATTAENVSQFQVRLSAGDPKTKRAALRAAIDLADVKTAIVFCNRKRDVDVVARSLQRHDYKADPIHGDLPQPVRTATLARFRKGDISLLVASDVAARGLDIPDVSHIFNYDVPRHPEDYVHRIGRTGRAGRSGAAFTIVSPEDSKSMAAVEKLIQKTVAVADVGEIAAPARGDDDRSDNRSDDRAPARGRSRAKSSRSRGGARGAPKAENKPEAKPETKPETKPAAAEPPHQAVEADDKPAPRAPKRSRGDESHRRDEPRRNERADGRRREVGLGDHTPAFLLRPVKETADAKG